MNYVLGQKITFGQITKDSWITTQIKSKLFVGDNVKATDVKVITEMVKYSYSETSHNHKVTQLQKLQVKLLVFKKL